MRPLQFKAGIPRAPSKGEYLMGVQLKIHKIEFQREFKFHPKRRWRFDFALSLPHHIAIEIEGGTWSNGAHTRGKHFEEDCEKYAEATILGWRVMRFTTAMVENGYAIDCIRRAIQ